MARFALASALRRIGTMAALLLIACVVGLSALSQLRMMQSLESSMATHQRSPHAAQHVSDAPPFVTDHAP